MAPLDGITVVSFEHAIAAPFASRQLAELGARVIKIERPGVGDFARGYDERVNGLASHFVWTNRSKQSLSLNLKHPKASDILDRLFAETDVVLQNLAPGAAARLGISFEELHPKFNQIIVCDISGYGSGGSYLDRKAYDLMIQAEAGFLSVTGTQDDPAKAGISIADIAAGMYAYSGILAALIQRSKTGEGSHIDISMLEAMAEWMSYPMYYAFDGAEAPARSGADHATIFPYGLFETGDNERIFLAIQNEREWEGFCAEVLGQPELAKDVRFARNSLRKDNKEQLKSIIKAAFANLSQEMLVERLDKAAIANASMNDMRGLWDHPQLKARNRWTQVSSPAGLLPALLPPGRPENAEAAISAIPDVGEHSGDILTELGYSQSEIELLSSEGTI